MDDTLRRWEAEPVSAAALAQARQTSDEHEDMWRQRHGEIPVPLT
jgi:hypothetical protein